MSTSKRSLDGYREGGLISGMHDPRPHVGDPLALDLLNTRWMSADGPQDLLVDGAGVRCWLQINDLTDRCDAGAQAREALPQAREAVLPAVTDGPPEELNEVRGHGCIRRRLTAAGPRDEPDVGDPA